MYIVPYILIMSTENALHQLEKEQAVMCSQLETIAEDVKEIKTDIKDVVHDRISRANAKTDENRQTISRMQVASKPCGA